MNTIKTIMKKELGRVLLDRKLIFSLFILPAVLMLGIMYLSMTLASGQEEDIKKHVPVVYVENAPESFLSFLDSKQVDAEVHELASGEEVSSICNQIIDGDVDLLYVFDEGFEDQIAGYQTNAAPKVQEFYNPSEDYSEAAMNVFEVLLSEYQQSLLVDRFGSIEVLTAFQVEQQTIVDENKAAGEALAQILPYFISILLFAGSMGLVVDAVAGEKERGTLASMLLTPAKRSNIVIGKILSFVILSSISATIYFVVMFVGLPAIMSSSFGAEFGGMTFSLGVGQGVELLLILLGMVFLYIALVMMVSILAKDTKTASSYVSPFYILVVVIGMASMFSGNNTPESYFYLIPLYGNTIAIQAIMTNTLSLVNFLLNIGSTVEFAAILVAGISRAFNSERIMFNA